MPRPATLERPHPRPRLALTPLPVPLSNMIGAVENDSVAVPPLTHLPRTTQG